MRYDDERLGRLLALLRPAPKEWVARAQLIPQTELDVRELTEKLEADPVLRKSFDEDPVGATESTGLTELAIQMQRELVELIALAETDRLEVAAHAHGKSSLRDGLRGLLLRSEAVRRRLGADE